MTLPKYHNNLSGINTKDMDICDFLDKEIQNGYFKRRKLNDLQENTERQFNKIKKMIHEQNEKSLTKRNRIKRGSKQDFWSEEY